MKRLLYLDSLKGLLIILVIIGHAVQFTIPEYEKNFIFRFIYSFHMPLFFFISGFLANRGKYDSDVVKKRAYQLLIPFVTWSLISPTLYNGYWDFYHSIEILIYPDKGLWFLYNLFIYSAIFNIAELLEQKYDIRHCFSVGGMIACLYGLMFLFHTKFNCSQLCYHILFYAIGYYYRSVCFEKYKYIKQLSGMFFILTVLFWVPNGEPLFYKYLNLGGIFAYIYRYLVQIAGLIFFYELGRTYLNKNIFWLQKIGISTLGIYAIQFPILHLCVDKLMIENHTIKIITISVIAIPTCYLIVVGIRKIRYLRLFLIGEK